MRTHVRLATTAGVTVLGLAAMSGVAQADTGGLGLTDLTGSLGKTVSGLVAPKSSSGGATKSGGSQHSVGGLKPDLPLRIRLAVPPSPPPAHKPHHQGHAGKKGKIATVDVNASAGAVLDPSAHVDLSLGLCLSLPAECGAIPPHPPVPVPPSPPLPPTPNPPPSTPPAPPSSGSGAVTAGSGSVLGRSLPFTGGPIGAMAFLGAGAVLIGAAGLGGSRLRLRRSPR